MQLFWTNNFWSDGDFLGDLHAGSTDGWSNNASATGSSCSKRTANCMLLIGRWKRGSVMSWPHLHCSESERVLRVACIFNSRHARTARTYEFHAKSLFDMVWYWFRRKDSSNRDWLTHIITNKNECEMIERVLISWERDHRYLWIWYKA